MGKYDDIIHMPHHVSTRRPRMTMENRAAQFSPFAALTGYNNAIAETGRLTDERVELAENAIAALDMKLSMLADMVADHPYVSVTHFLQDDRKKGGAYEVHAGALKTIDGVNRLIVFMDGKEIAIGDILEIESELFAALI